MPFVSLALAIRADSQVPTPTDDPRLCLADAQLAPAAPRGGCGETFVQPPHGGHVKQDHRISRCGVCYNINTVTAL